MPARSRPDQSHTADGSTVDKSRGVRRRTDAERNRSRLLAAATAAFTAGEARVSMESIARAAGVGIGTLYRHFPTREALVEAVYRSELESLCDQMPELVASMEPDAALRTWMSRYADFFETKREVAEALRPVINSGAVSAEQTRAKLSDAIRIALDAGAGAGSLRDDVPAEDVIASLVGIMLATGPTEQRKQTERMLDLLLDGLRRPRLAH